MLTRSFISLSRNVAKRNFSSKLSPTERIEKILIRLGEINGQQKKVADCLEKTKVLQI